VTRLTAAQREAALDLDRGHVRTEDEQRDLIRRHWLERAPILPPDVPASSFPLAHLQADPFL
jgi:hypothetical protein